MAAKVRALQEWCRRQCEGYRDVGVTNMTSSWKSGLAFCAIIHRYRPDLIDYDRLSKEDVFENNKLAFDVALDELGIPALLDPEDMVMMAVPDKLCIVTYVAQYYNYFHNKPRVGGPTVKTATKRALDRENAAPVVRPTDALQPSSAKKSAFSATVENAHDGETVVHRGGTLDDRCQMCRGRVYLLERHYTAGGQLYHRHCYRAAERTATLRKAKPQSDVASTVSSSSPGNVELATDARSRGSELPSNVTSSAQDARDVTRVVSSHSVTVSSASTALVKAIYSTACYKPLTTAAPPGEYVRPAVSGHDGTLIPSPAASCVVTPSSAPVTSQHSRTVTDRASEMTSRDQRSSTSSTPVVTSTSEMTSVRDGVMTGGHHQQSVTVTGGPQQSVVAAARSQYLQRLNAPVTSTSTRPNTPVMTVSTPSHLAGSVTSQYLQRLNAPVTTTSTYLQRPNTPVTTTSTVSTPSHLAGSVTSAAPTSSSCSVLSRLSRPVTAADGLKVSTSETVRSERTLMSASVAVSAVCVPNRQLMRTSALSSCHSAASAATSHYSSPFVKDRMLTATVTTTSCVRSTPHHSINSYTSAMNSAPVTPALHAEGRHLRSAQLSPRQIGSTASNVTDSVMVSSVLGKLAEARERKEQTRSAVRQSPVERTVASCCAPVTLTTDSRTTAYSRAATVTSNKADWQLEAERRQAARNGVYVDPEKYPRKAVQQQIGQQQRPGLYSVSHTAASSKPAASRVAAVAHESSMSDVVMPPSLANNIGVSAQRCLVRRPRSKPNTTNIRLPHSDFNPGRHSVHRDRFMSRKSDSSQPVMTADEIVRRLEQLDAALRVVESEGRELEEKIRKDTDDAMDDDKDSRMVTWFALIKRRNELIREESDLMYRRRQQELEELHEELEYQLRPLLDKPDEQKTMKEKRDEEQLLQELLEVVSLRNNIVDSIEVDRLRYIEEDRRIEDMILESGLSQGKNNKAAAKGRRKKKAQKKESTLPARENSTKKTFHFTARSSSLSPPPQTENQIDTRQCAFKIEI